jgi:formylglycine-generating enzyme required for sulfatase activity
MTFRGFCLMMIFLASAARPCLAQGDTAPQAKPAAPVAPKIPKTPQTLLSVTADGDYTWKLGAEDKGRITARTPLKVPTTPGPHEITAASTDGRHFRETVNAERGKTTLVKIAAPAETTAAPPIPAAAPPATALDPNTYTRAQIMPSKSPLNGQIRLMIYFYSQPPLYPPFIDSALSISFRKGTAAPWRLDAADRQVSPGGELWHLNLNPDDVGDRAAVCFVAHDKPSGRQREWMQRYKITAANAVSLGVNFIPDGDATLRLTDGEPCDGVKLVRREQPAATSATLPVAPAPAPALRSDDQIAAMRTLASGARTFGRITVSATKKDRTNNGNWLLKVSTSPFRTSTTLYDVNVQVVMRTGNKTWPVLLSNREMFVHIENRYASLDEPGKEAVVCFTARDPARPQPMRMTDWFSIETRAASWPTGESGETAAFVPRREPTLEPASDAPCQFDTVASSQPSETAPPVAEAHAPAADQSRLTWTDPSTGLMWAKRDNGSPVTPYQASTYCQSLDLAGHSDWRLPTIAELRGIYDPDANVPCIGLTCHINPNLPPSASSMWSSDIATPAGSVTLFSFLQGKALVPGNQFTNARALCMRATGAQPAPIEDAERTKALATPPHANPHDGLLYVPIPPGSFQMGCSPGDSCLADAKPAHRVTITKGFWIGQTTVTVAAWKRYREAAKSPKLSIADALGRKIWNEAGPLDRPAVMVTWDQAQSYCRWSGLRLPTEAEWEYAARAGVTQPRYGDPDSIAWYADNSGKQRLNSTVLSRQSGASTAMYLKALAANENINHAVGEKLPNPWRLYDMLGNVWQWTADWYSETYYRLSQDRDPAGPPTGNIRVVRGGSSLNPPAQITLSWRNRFAPETIDTGIGFRCAGDL